MNKLKHILKKQIHHNNNMKGYILLNIFCILAIGLFGQCLEGDCVNGRGSFISSDNHLYVGTFKDGKLNGKGVCHFSWGTKYVGEWTNGDFNGEGVYYYPEGKIEKGIWENGILITLNEAIQNSKFHAIVVGINEYDDNNLKYAASDAKSIYQLLVTSQFSTYASGDIRLLLNQGATVDKLKSSLTTIKEQAGKDDIFMFFFFGNGKNQSFDLVDGTIQFSELNDMFADIKTSQKISFVDLNEPKTGNDMFALKEPTKVEPTEFENDIIYLEKLEESTLEYDGLRFGIMQHYLYQSLRGAGDTNIDGKTNIKEIHKYLSKKIRDYTDGYLVPNLLMTETDTE